MSVGNAIKAGAAFVELTLKDSSFHRGLRNAAGKLKTLGSDVAKIGGIATAAGAALIAPFAAAVKSFSDAGSALNDMSARTGASAKALAELGYAASQTGASAEDVETGFGKMAKTITDAVGGSKSAIKTIDDLGLSVDALSKLSPEEQFETIGKALNEIEDPTRKAAMAMEVFGKSGKKLTPMFADIDALKSKARDLNIVPDQSQVELADRLGDSLDNVKAAAGGVVFQIGAALAGAVADAADTISGIVTTAGRWVKENKQLVVTIAKVAVCVAVVGSVITGLGLAIAGAGVVLGGIASALTAVGAVIGAVLSPIGLLTAALAGSVYAWAKWTKSGQTAVSTIAGILQPIIATARATFSGIVDAIGAGDLALAGKIAAAGLKAGFLQGIDALVKAAGGVFGDFIGKIAAQLSGGDFTGAWQTVLLGIGAGWDSLIAGITSSTTGLLKWIINGWTEATKSMVSLWLTATKSISDSIIAMAKQFPKLGKLVLGVDVDDSQKQLDKQFADKQARLERLKKAISEAERSDTKSAAVVPGGKQHSLDDLQTSKRDLERDLASGSRSIFEDAQRSAAQQLDSMAGGMSSTIDALGGTAKSALDELNAWAQQNASRSANDLADGDTAASTAADAAESELDSLLEEARKLAKERKAADDASKRSGTATGEDDESETESESDKPDKQQKSIFGTFAAAAAGLMGPDNIVAERTAKATERTAKAAEETASNTSGKSISAPPVMPPQVPFAGKGFENSPIPAKPKSRLDEAKEQLGKNHSEQTTADRIAEATPKSRLDEAKEQLGKNHSVDKLTDELAERAANLREKHREIMERLGINLDNQTPEQKERAEANVAKIREDRDKSPADRMRDRLREKNREVAERLGIDLKNQSPEASSPLKYSRTPKTPRKNPLKNEVVCSGFEYFNGLLGPVQNLISQRFAKSETRRQSKSALTQCVREIVKSPRVLVSISTTSHQSKRHGPKKTSPRSVKLASHRRAGCKSLKTRPRIWPHLMRASRMFRR